MTAANIIKTTAGEIEIVTPPSIDQVIDQFIAAQDVKQTSKDLYRRTLKLYIDWVGRRGYTLKDITRTEILQYKSDLLASGMSSLTVGSYITSVRRFYEWTEASKYYPNVAKGIKSPKRKQQFRKQALTEDQSKSLLAHYEGQKLNLRDFAIVSLLLRTGLRTIEVIRANVEDITFKGSKRVLMVHGKGRDEKDNFVILTDKTYAPIKAYLESRGRVKTGEPLFTSSSNNNKGGRLTTRSVSALAKEGLKSIGLDSRAFTAHSLRHTTAVSILRATNDLSQTQAVLRHANPATTQIYTASIKEELRLKNAPEERLDALF